MKRRFQTTRWSLVSAARRDDDARAGDALAALCEAYWYPLYVFVRRLGHREDDALDLTQGYFAELLEKRFLDDVRPEAGRFRNFLLASIKHYLANARRREGARKRGGGRKLLPLDAEGAEQRYRAIASDAETPAQEYERQWALTVLQRARERLRDEFEERDQQERYRLLAGYLSEGEGDRGYREVGEELGLSEPAVAMAVRRMRRRLGVLLREEIAQTVRGDEQVESELRHLLAVVRSR